MSRVAGGMSCEKAIALGDFYRGLAGVYGAEGLNNQAIGASNMATGLYMGGCGE
jgi:hypothetical protein